MVNPVTAGSTKSHKLAY